MSGWFLGMLEIVLNADEAKPRRCPTFVEGLLLIWVDLRTDDEYRAPMHFILIDFRLEGVQMRVSIFAEENQVQISFLLNQILVLKF